MANFNELDIENESLLSFLNAVWEKYGVDFRDYGKAHIKRRIRHRMTIAKYDTYIALREDVLDSKLAFDGLFGDFSINVTELFRDPQFWEDLKQRLMERDTNKAINIWITACASGEEVFSVIMMLEYYKINYGKIIATDFNAAIVQEASEGIIEASKIEGYKKNLSKTNFELDFNDYFRVKSNYYQLKPEYLSKIEFITHNLMETPDFGTFDIVMCRNVLIYFEKNLQNRVINHLTDSLASGGLLCLGSKESMRFMDGFSSYETISQSNKIYQKK